MAALIALLALSGMAAALPAQGQATPVDAGVRATIERRADASAQIFIDTPKGGAFTLGTPAGWYPVVFPLTREEAGQLNEIFAANNVPLSIGEAQLADQSSLGSSGLWLTVFSLNPAHYQNSRTTILGAVLDVPAWIPEWSIGALQALSRLDEIQRSAILEIDNQPVADLEFVVRFPEQADVLQGRMLLFVRSGHLFFFFGATDHADYASAISDTIGYMRDSLDFDPAP